MDFKVVATGFCLLESPRADEQNVWFSDMALGGVRCLRPDGRLDAWLLDRKMIGGIAVNDDGALLCSGTGGIIWFNPATGAAGTLLATIDGKPISGVNDMAADGKGGLYFGTVDHERMFRGEDFFNRSAIYRLAPDGRVTQLCKDLKFSNGIGISPDGRYVYVNNSGVGTFAYEQLPDGSLDGGRQLSDRADCDGLAVDREGGIWVAQIGARVIARLRPSGKVDREIAVQSAPVTSLCFGGPDGQDLFVTTAAPGAGEAVMKRTVPALQTASLLRGRVEISGVSLPRTRFRLQPKAD